MSMKIEPGFTSYTTDPPRSNSSGSGEDTPESVNFQQPRQQRENGDGDSGIIDYSSDVGYSSAAPNSTYISSYNIPQHPSLFRAGPLHAGQQQQQQQQSSTSPQNQPSPPLMSPSSEYAPNNTSMNAQLTAQNPAITAAQSAAPTGTRRAAPSTPPVPLACTECRLRHLKCDAGVPTCGRCRSENRQCTYIKSRRGWKGRKRKGTLGANTGATSQSEDNASVAEDNAVPRGLHPLKSPDPVSNPLETIRNQYKGFTKFLSPHEAPPPAPTANLIQLYYAYFHAAHPFVLPPAYLIKTPAHMLKHLLPSMRFMGSFFARNANQKTFRDSAEASLFRQGAPKNAWTVQALMLFAIGLHAANEQEKAGQIRDYAVEMALELGMNYEEFAYTAGVAGVSGSITRRGSVGLDDFDARTGTSLPGSNAVLEESWRRTWWELYFLDGIIAGVHQKDQFRLWTVECTVPLPCEEVAYNTGQVSPPRSLQEFDDRYFATDDTVFSSFSYRVEAVRIMGQVLAAQQANSETDAADASIGNWFLHLPDEKKEIVGKDGKLDEMLFQAHMVIHATTVYLHRPKSHLIYSIVPDDTACTPVASTLATSSKPQIFHTLRSIKAADSISRLITLPSPLIKHTPFFTCIITLASIVHLSACSWILYGDEGYLAKERIRLAVGALKTLESVWTVAAFVLGQVKLISREVFRLPKPLGIEGGGLISEEEVMRFIEEERALGGNVGETVGGEVGWDGTEGFLSEMLNAGRIISGNGPMGVGMPTGIAIPNTDLADSGSMTMTV